MAGQNFVGPDFGPIPTDPGGSTVNLPTPGQTPDAPDLGYGVLPDLQIPTTPVVVQSSPYWEYAISKIVYDESGYMVNVVQQGPPFTDVIRPFPPSGSVVVRWISKRKGDPPIIPSRDTGCPNEVYLRGWVTAAVPGQMTDGTACHVVSGCYYYALQQPYTENDVITLGRFPYTNLAANDNQIRPEQYDKTLIGPSVAPYGAPTTPLAF